MSRESIRRRDGAQKNQIEQQDPIVHADYDIMHDFAKTNDANRLFAELHKRYTEKLRGYVFSMTQNEQTAKDIVQEVFRKAWEQLLSVDKSSVSDFRISAWMYRVAKNLTYNKIRDTNRHRRLERENIDPNMQYSFHPAQPDEEVQKNDVMKIVGDAVHEVSENPEQEDILRLHIAGHTSAEIAQIQKIPEGTVFSRLGRAKAHLRDVLADHAIETPAARKSAPRQRNKKPKEAA